jgi:methyl-accepting chemotaxis protein
MRRGAASTAKAVAEQATVGDQVSKEAEQFSRLTANVTKAMAEQAAAAGRGTPEQR